MIPHPVPEFLEWDSKHFGLRIARVEAPRTGADWQAIDTWALANEMDCIYVFASGRDPTAIRLAEEHAARCLDERMILETIVSPSPAVAGLRLADQSDLPTLEKIAAQAFTESRFFRDPNFRRDLSEELFRTWIRRSVHGWAQAALVSGEIGRPSGFVTCRDGKIDLLAVAKSDRGKGIGTTLTHGAKHWFATHGVRRVSVLARLDNDAAVRMYKRCGFVPARTEFLFHKWYKR